MNKKNIIGILLVSLLAIIAGCSGGSDNGAKQSGILDLGEGKSGKLSSGVKLSTEKENFPSEMFKGEPAKFKLVFENNQLHEVDDLIIRTKGFDRSFVSGLSEEYSVPTVSKASEGFGPGIESLVIDGVVVDGDFDGNYNFNPEFDHCYTAETVFRESVCVPSSKNQCNTDVEKNSVQNGPLTLRVKSITNVPDHIRVEFTLNNAIPGEVVNECFETEDFQNSYDLVSVKLGNTEGSCFPIGTSDYLIADKKTVSFYCEFSKDSGNEDSYSSIITAELSYKYQQATKLPVVVRDLNQGFN